MEKGGKSEARGRSPGGLTTKIHLVCGAKGRPMRFILTCGQALDGPQAVLLLTGIEASAVLADKGYESNKTSAFIRSGGATAVIRPRATGKSLGNMTGNCTGSEISWNGHSTS